MSTTQWDGIRTIVSKWYVRLPAALLAAMALVAGVYYYVFMRSVPSDEEMLAHFQAHRSEMQALVDHYRSYSWPLDGSERWEMLPEVVDLLKRARIDYVAYELGTWLSDPYSKESAQRLREMTGTTSIRANHKQGTLKLDIQGKQTGVVWVRFGHSAYVLKDFYNFPVAPRIDSGKLLLPFGLDGKPIGAYRVMDTLDRFPKDWSKGECLLRAIDEKWFLRLCWGAI